ncbi:lipopolysaccharide biosynthesis protein [Arthrobacter sp. PL16]|uniref:lipopolysaccharide biosynthesis protein n=1 Tax=Arthrobacter sp. PL16 TaxID=3071720 RepID=UPI002E10177D
MAVVTIIWSGDLVHYGLIMTVVSLTSIAMFHRKTFQRTFIFLEPPARPLVSALRFGFPAAIVATVSLGFSALPLPLVSATQSLVETGQFASAQKLYVYGLIVVTSTMDAVQAWALKGDAADREARTARVSVVMGLVGIAGALVFAFGGTGLTTLLFGSEVAAHRDVNLGFALAYLASSIATVAVRLVLIPEGLSKIVLRNNIVAVVGGIALMLVGAATLGIAGVGLGLGTGQCVYCVLNWMSVRGYRRR